VAGVALVAQGEAVRWFRVSVMFWVIAVGLDVKNIDFLRVRG
jgi:hypothetical protein